MSENVQMVGSNLGTPNEDNFFTTEAQRYKEKVRGERKDRIGFLREWIGFAIHHSCIRQKDFQNLYRLSYAFFNNSSSEGRECLADNLLSFFLKNEDVSVMLSDVSFVPTQKQSCLLKECFSDRTGKTVWETGISLMESEDPADTDFKKYYLESVLCVICDMLQTEESLVVDFQFQVALDAIYVAILKERSSLITDLTKNLYRLCYQKVFTENEYRQIARLLGRQIDRLEVSFLRSYGVLLRSYFHRPSETSIVLVPKSLGIDQDFYRGVRKSFFEATTTFGKLFSRHVDAVYNSGDLSSQRSAEFFVIVLLRDYLVFCLKHTITLRDHEFARAVLGFCDKD